MEEQLAKLDLFKLREDIERKLRAIWKLQKAGERQRARPVYSQTGSSGLAPAPELFPSGRL
jgi:hypothetical protein